MKFKVLRTALAVFSLMILSATVVVSQDVPPISLCGEGNNAEPSQEPNCTNGLICDVFRVCINAHLHYGLKLKKCCYYNAVGSCVQVYGRWECCDVDGGQWKKECKVVSINAQQTCNGVNCN